MVRDGEFSRDPHRDLAALRISAQNLPIVSFSFQQKFCRHSDTSAEILKS